MLLVEIIVGVIHIGLWVWPFNALSAATDLRQGIAVIGIIFAVATAMYTGILNGFHSGFAKDSDLRSLAA